MKLRIPALFIILQLLSIELFPAGLSGQEERNNSTTREKSPDVNRSCQGTIPGAKNRLVLTYGLGGGLSYISVRAPDPEDPIGLSYVKTNYLKPCISSNLRMGFAPTEKFFISWNARTNFFREVLYSESDKTEWLAGGGAGLGITFFPFRSGLPLYITGQFGYSNIFKGFGTDFNNFGTEIAAGAGYVFLNRFSTELCFQMGTSEKSYYYGSIRNPLIVNLTLNYIFWKPKKS